MKFNVYKKSQDEAAFSFVASFDRPGSWSLEAGQASRKERFGKYLLRAHEEGALVDTAGAPVALEVGEYLVKVALDSERLYHYEIKRAKLTIEAV